MMKNLNILVVDDSRIARMVVRGILEQINPDFVIGEASSGREADVHLENGTWDMMILDHSMPGETGLDYAARLKDRQLALDIFILTANIQHEMKAKAGELGVGFIEKPPTEEKLRAIFNGLD
ncbi:MAG: response regulator [Alphaproteobacteria bacterium]|nr:response regulator [Alphaproteobacteria bacterium]MBF0249492.1 response regulator [Alphaproteobacteria bacterium]